MRKLFFYVGCIVFSTLIYGNLKAKGLNPSQRLSEIESFYAKSKDLQVEFSQIEINNLLGRKKESSGIIYVIGGEKLFWHTKHPSILKVISNGKKVWMVEQQVFERSWDELDAQMKVALNLISGKSDFKKHFKIQWRDQKACTFELTPLKLKNIEKMQVEADCAKKILKQVHFFFPLERQTILKFQNMQRNTGLEKKHHKKSLDPQIDRAFNFIK